jgi:hypothetical protein
VAIAAATTPTMIAGIRDDADAGAFGAGRGGFRGGWRRRLRRGFHRLRWRRLRLELRGGISIPHCPWLRFTVSVRQLL